MNRPLFSTLIFVFFVYAQDRPQHFYYPADTSAPLHKQFCIAFEQNVKQSQIESILNRFSARVVKRLSAVDNPVYVVEISTRENPSVLKRKIEDTPGVFYVTGENQEPKNLAVESTPIRRSGKATIKKPAKTQIEDGAVGLQTKYQQVVIKHLPGLYACVSKRLESAKKKGKYALIEATVDMNGRIKQVRIKKSNIRDPRIIGCLRKKVYTWRDFPARHSPPELQIRFNFRY